MVHSEKKNVVGNVAFKVSSKIFVFIFLLCFLRNCAGIKFRNAEENDPIIKQLINFVEKTPTKVGEKSSLPIANLFGGPEPEPNSWISTNSMIKKRLETFASKRISVDDRSLVVFHVGDPNVKDSMEVAENNMKIFTSSITQHTSKATYQAVYLFNVIGVDNPLARFIPVDNENVAVLKWDSSSSDMVTHTRTVELLGAGITEQFNSIVFLNQGSRGPLNKRADGEWLGDFSRLLSVEKVGLAGASISCEVAPHVQTHTLAVKPAMIPTLSAFLADARRGDWAERVKHFEVDLSVWARSAGFEIGSNLYSRRGNQDSFSKCLTPAEGSPKTVTANPTSWCDLKASEVTFQKWGGEPLRTNGFICETAKDNMHNTLVELQKAEPSLALTIPETLVGGHRFELYQQYQQEVRVSGEVASVTIEDKTSDKVCFLVRAYDSSEKVTQSPFIHYGLPSIIASLQKQNDPNWLAVFVNTDNRDYFSTLSATVGSYSDARLKTIDIPKEFRPAFTPADAGYTATDYALRELETWSQCKYITVTNSDNVYGSEVVQRVLAAGQSNKKGAAPDMLLAPLDSRNFVFQDLSNRGLENVYSSRCTEIMAILDFSHLVATASPIPKLGKVDLASMFFNRVKLVQEKLNFNDVRSHVCPGCQDGLMAEYLVRRRFWTYQRMPIDGLQSIVFHGPSPTLCIASGNVWFDYPMVNGGGCYNHSMVVTLYHDPKVNTAFDWGNFDRNDKMCLRLNENSFLNVATGRPMTQDASLRKLVDIRLESSIIPSELPSVSPTAAPSSAPTVRDSDTPTMTPTLTPSAVPSVEPSAAPSSTPSELPSATPSVTPSATPSVTPSNTPSATPSEVPSATPSVTPSAIPSVTPSVVPSVVPSEAPSTSPAPTSTRSPIVIVTTQTLSGVNLAEYNANKAKNDETVTETIVETLPGIETSDVYDLTAKAGPSTSRRLRATDSHNTANNRALGTAADSIIISYTIITNKAGLTAASLTQQLTDAVTSGQFTTTLRATATALNAPDLLGAASDEIETTNDSPAPSGNSDPEISGSGVMGIVIAGLVLFAAVLIIVQCYYPTPQKRILTPGELEEEEGRRSPTARRTPKPPASPSMKDNPMKEARKRRIENWGKDKLGRKGGKGGNKTGKKGSFFSSPSKQQRDEDSEEEQEEDDPRQSSELVEELQVTLRDRDAAPGRRVVGDRDASFYRI